MEYLDGQASGTYMDPASFASQNWRGYPPDTSTLAHFLVTSAEAHHYFIG